MSWQSPWLPAAGDPITAEKLRLVLSSLEQQFDHGITGADMQVDINGKFVMDADLDLLGHEIVNAGNVPTGMASVKSYGVLGNGDDDTIAIRSALAEINTLNYKLAFFPAGTYKITDEIVIPSGMSIFGAGSSTVFNLYIATNNPCGLRASNSCVIRDLSFTGDPGRVGILINGTGDVTVENVSANGIDTPVNISGASTSVSLLDIISTGCKWGCSITGGASVSINGLYANAPTMAGLAMSNCNGFSVTGAAVYQSTGYGFEIRDCFAGTISGGAWKSYKSGFLMSGCRHVNLTGCHSVDSSVLASSQSAGIDLISCTACSVRGCHSYLETTSQSQTYCLQVAGGSGDCCVEGNILYPTAAGLTTPEACMLIEGNNTEYGNFKVVL
jgi:hypothetical protein